MRFSSMFVALAIGCQPVSAAYLEIPPMSGDVTTPSGSSVATIAPGAVTSSKLAIGAAAGNLGFAPAHPGANSDITSLSGLTTPLSTAQGGTGSAGAEFSVTSSTTITTPGTYFILAANLTLTLPTTGVGGDAVIVDLTGSPNLTISGTVINSLTSPYVISVGKSSTTLRWSNSQAGWYVN